MPRERVELESAWLLAFRPYRETSALLEVLTAEHGRIGLVARGARGQRSRLRGLLQPFQPLLLSWLSAGDLGTLTGAEGNGVALQLTGERVFSGWYVNELVTSLVLRHDPQPELFGVYGETLRVLATADAHPGAALRAFEVALLQALGYGLPLADEYDPARRYTWDPEQGTQPCPDDEGFSGAALIALRDGHYDDAATRREVRKLLRDAIDRQLGGRELKSRRLLRAVRAR